MATTEEELNKLHPLKGATYKTKGKGGGYFTYDGKSDLPVWLKNRKGADIATYQVTPKKQTLPGSQGTIEKKLETKAATDNKPKFFKIIENIEKLSSRLENEFTGVLKDHKGSDSVKWRRLLNHANKLNDLSSELVNACNTYHGHAMGVESAMPAAAKKVTATNKPTQDKPIHPWARPVKGVTYRLSDGKLYTYAGKAVPLLLKAYIAEGGDLKKIEVKPAKAK
jgi:hypothetical protein